ncbi:uncharacterized protein M6B38_261695 [Iris pallida]|uniref:Uncharacterized protein n=1 Tax=Iris pallida TaxID=29817 RepID=A0AAX6IEP2_IRIPA|nr:uncharacterized protein M6B38_324700 [Iris pallida]KAJ6843027.1 uncharacterized protein M6B38_299780 [Iris pallida]KAJ6851317.1 uncharacterized protein M6B38_261695 [Iris pallida]
MRCLRTRHMLQSHHLIELSFYHKQFMLIGHLAMGLSSVGTLERVVPVMGVLYFSAVKLAFSNDNPLSYKVGDQTEWSYDKVLS